jgi:hypothetical protein
MAVPTTKPRCCCHHATTWKAVTDDYLHGGRRISVHGGRRAWGAAAWNDERQYQGQYGHY